MAMGRRKRLGVLSGLVAGVVLATGISLYATDSWPFRDSYCWGAWQENSGAWFLGEGALEESGSARRGTESAPPSAGRPEGTCTVAVSSTAPDDDSDEPPAFDERVVVEYGRVPAAVKERHAWIMQNFHGSASLLPDGLDGLVADDRAMLVLPEGCDVDGRPSVVTIRSERGDSDLGKVAEPFTIGRSSAVSRMLLDVANTGMAHAGCAPDEPLPTTSPLVTLAEDSADAGSPVCRIPGVDFGFGFDSQFDEQVGAVTSRLQTCSVVWRGSGEPDEPVAQYVMAREPRMTALFDGLPEGTDKGLAHATCDGRRTVFYGHVDGRLAEDPAVGPSFKNFVASVGRRIGCETGGQA